MSQDKLLLANVSRRGFLKGVAAGSTLVLAARWDFAQAEEAAAEEAKAYGADAMPHGWVDNPNVFISIASDGTVTITNHRAEMGQGIRTSLVMVIADGLGADWAKVRASQAPGDEEKYGNQNTDGSRSMRHWFDPLRRAGAAARTMLEQAAAQQWQVPVSECRAGVHLVEHVPSGKQLGFGELAAAAAELPVPARETLTLKTPDQWRYIHQDRKGAPLTTDGLDIVTGKAVFGADVSFDDMLYAVIARPPVYGAKPGKVDDSKALQVPGVVKVMKIEGAVQPAGFSPLGGVAVVAENTWAAIQGRKALQIDWDNSTAGDNASYDSGAYYQTLEQAVSAPGKVMREQGDVQAGFAKAAKRVTADYYMPHLAQAPMEPPVAIVRLQEDKIEAWAPVQNPQAARDGLAKSFELKPENVTVNVTLLGGGFGRKAKPDFVFEAAMVAKAFPGRALRMQWTREDDIQHSYYHTVSLNRLEAGLDAQGKTIAWQHRVASPSISSLFMPDPKHLGDPELAMGFRTLPFDIPAIRLENPEAPAHLRIGWFRSVYNLPHAFAIQSFVAELADAAGRDHRDYLLELLGPARQIDPATTNDEWNYGENPEAYPIDIGRFRAVVEKATSEAGWGREMPKGRGLGLAVHQSFASYAAVVIDAEVKDDGQVLVHSADIAFDCGPQINPERIRSQLEGSCVMGIGIALYNEITAKDGSVEQTNFHQYLMARMPDAPKQLRVHLINHDMDVALGGVGEPGMPPVAPALCNAIFAATGKRIRRLPVKDQLAVA